MISIRDITQGRDEIETLQSAFWLQTVISLVLGAALAVSAAAVPYFESLGSALVIANRWAWLGAGMLAVFTALTIPIAHNFWAMQEPMRTLEFHFVAEHITVIGGLMVVAWKSATASAVPAQ